MNGQDEIDRRLRESGERWRAQPLSIPAIDEAMFHGRPAARSVPAMKWLSAAAGMAVVALVGAVALRTVVDDPTRSGVGLASPTTEATAAPSPAATSASPVPQPTDTPGPTLPPSSPSPSDSSDPLLPLPAVVSEGDPVVAYGYLVESDSGVLLCEMLVVRAAHAPPRCFIEPQVPITGVNVRELGSDMGGQWVSDYVRVDGVWNGGALAAERVSPAERPSGSEQLARLIPGNREVPCETPPGGWPTPPPDDQSIQPLLDEVDSHPEKYVGVWDGVTTAAEGNDLVVIVGTVNDVASVAAELHSMYPFDLCVTSAEYSRLELQDVAARLSPMDPDWGVHVVASLSRVVVRLVVVDALAAQDLRPYADRVIARPIVDRAD